MGWAAHMPQKGLFRWDMSVHFQTVLWSTTDDNAREIATGDYRHANYKCRAARVDIFVVGRVGADRGNTNEVTVRRYLWQWDGFLLEYFGHGTGSTILPYFACRRRCWSRCAGHYSMVEFELQANPGDGADQIFGR